MRHCGDCSKAATLQPNNALHPTPVCHFPLLCGVCTVAGELSRWAAGPQALLFYYFVALKLRHEGHQREKTSESRMMKSPRVVNGSTYLVLGILSIVCPLLGPVTWSMSNNALNILDFVEENDADADTSQRGLVEAGYKCGLIGTVLFGIGLLVLFLRTR